MNARIERLFGWSGIAFMAVFTVGYWLVAGFLPPPSPDHSAAWVADYFADNQDGIRWGMIIMQIGACLLGLFVVAMFLQTRRIHRGLAYVVLAMGTILVLQFIYIDFIWQAAAFRADRDPNSVLALYDLAWLPFLGAGGPLLFMILAFSTAILLDKRPRPAFPRWLSYLGYWVAFASVPGELTVLFKTGPLAWNGVITFWLALAVFGAWIVINSIYLVKAVEIEAEEPPPASGNGRDAEMAEEIKDLKEQLERLSARVG